MHRHPTQSNDAWDAYQWLLSHIDDLGGDGKRVVVGGISAGASLASSVAVRQNRLAKAEASTQGRFPSPIMGLVLGIPWLYHIAAFPFDLLESKEVSAYHENRFAPILPRTQLEQFADLLAPEDHDDDSLFVGNVDDDDVRGLPRTAFLVAGRDPLRDDALLFDEKLKRNG